MEILLLYDVYSIYMYMGNNSTSRLIYLCLIYKCVLIFNFTLTKRSVFMLTSRGNKIRNFTFLILKAFVDKWKKKTKTLMFGVKGLPKVVIPTFCFIYILIRNEIKLWLIGLLRMVFLSLRQFWRNYFFVSGKNVFLQSNFVNKLSVLSPHAVSLD